MLAMRGASSCWRGVGWIAPSGRSEGAAVRPLEPVAASSRAQPPGRASGTRILRRELAIRDIRGAAPRVWLQPGPSLTALRPTVQPHLWKCGFKQVISILWPHEAADCAAGHRHGIGGGARGLPRHDPHRLPAAARVLRPPPPRARPAPAGPGLVLVARGGIGGPAFLRTSWPG